MASSSSSHQESPMNWIDRWLGINFYNDHCETHVAKYKTVFCCTCMEKHVCEICWRETIDQHKDHQYLEVRRASRRTAVEVGDISKHCDVSKIQTYVINYKDVVYLNPNKGTDIVRNCPFKCNSCNRKLIDSKFKFCSIACKMKVVGFVSLQNKSTCLKQSQRGIMSLRQTISSYRKKPRKGIPVRSPLK